MKKLILMLFLVVGGVMNAAAQRAESDKISIYVYNGAGLESVQLYYWIDGSEGVWKTSDGNISLDGRTWEKFTFDASTWTASAYNILVGKGSWGESKTQSEDYKTRIYNDSFFEIAANGDSKCTITKQTGRMYIYNTTGTSIPMSNAGTVDNVTSYTATIDNQTSTSNSFFFVVAADYAFNNDGTLNWSGQTGNYWRASQNGDKELDFENLTNYSLWRNNSTAGTFKISNKPFTFNLTFKLDNTWDACKLDVSPSFTRTFGQYGTFSSNYDVAIPDGIKAYYAGSKDGSNIMMSKYESGIDAHQGAFIQAKNGTGGTYTFTPAASTDNPATNYLKEGTSKFTGGVNSYVFAKQNGVFGFYKYNSSAVDLTGKAYLDVTGAGARLNLVFDDSEATGIANVREAANNKQFFNLNGQRVAQPQKGLYIVNGKKMIMK